MPYEGDIANAVVHVNKNHGAHLVFQFVQMPDAVKWKTTIIYKFNDYPTYLWWCEKNGHMPVATKQFMGG
jgi:hypothetical protein